MFLYTQSCKEYLSLANKYLDFFSYVICDSFLLYLSDKAAVSFQCVAAYSLT